MKTKSLRIHFKIQIITLSFGFKHSSIFKICKLQNQQARNNIAGYNTLVSADRGRFELPAQFPARLSFSQVL